MTKKTIIGMIFISEETKAVYYWNGMEAITVHDSPTKSRPVGRIAKGLDNESIQKGFLSEYEYFTVGFGAKYKIIQRISHKYEFVERDINNI